MDVVRYVPSRRGAPRLRILAAAEEMFADDGYTGSSIAAIARRAGMSAQTVCHLARRLVELGALNLISIRTEPATCCGP